MKQNQRAKTEVTREDEVDDAPAKVQDEELSEAVDDLLADIDDVLEENAEEFVKAYVQKGGQ